MSVTVVVLGHLRAENPKAAGGGGNAFAGLMVGFGLVVGPLAGGTLVAHASWRWIFGVNVPLAVAAWLAVATCLRLPRGGDAGHLDLPGAAAGALLLARASSVRPSIVAGTGLAALALGGLALTGTATPLAVLLALLAVLGAGVGLGIGNEVILVQAAVERRDLGTATTGVRFVETLGTSVAAAAFAAFFAAGTGGGPLEAGHVMATLEVIFATGAIALAVATVIGLRLPSGPGAAQRTP
jgi:hypothetical protein